MKRRLTFFLLIFVFLFSYPFASYSAEILQISNSSTLLIGDQNRTYTVKIACLDVDPSNEEAVISFIGSELPRHSRVNLKPKGAKNGILISKVIKIGEEEDMATKIISNGLAKFKC